MVLTAKVKKSINTSLRIIIAFLAIWFIYTQINNSENLISFSNSIKSAAKGTQFRYLIIISILLMPFNWGIESYKWKTLISYVERVSFVQAYKSVLTGITMSLFTPNRVGEFFGRLLTLKYAHPLKGAFLTITGSISQLLTTILMGIVAICFFIPFYFDLHDNSILISYILISVSAIMTGIFLVMMYLNVSGISRLTRGLIKPGWQKIRGYLRVMRRLKRHVLVKVLSLSILRYCIFSSQFYLLLVAFGIKIPWFESFVLISMIYFTMTVIPTIALVDLGIRGSVSVYFLSMFTGDQPGATIAILAASTSVWIINLAFPSLLGLLFINRIKLIRKI